MSLDPYAYEFPERAAASIDAAFAEYREQKDEMQRDVDHAVREAKRRVPDYPWEGVATASEAVWAIGSSLEGTDAALGDWRKLCEQLIAFVREVADDCSDRVSPGLKQWAAEALIWKGISLKELPHEPVAP